ncbi:hypothetical protein PVL30_003799 [Lodderomyces elongisporus]|uniref:uncharacterized protein n=1 Tax=Lodderomyces elongisporus TaxID=36914 RepID=UPI0029208B2F|nr:uncharacterized protein PVL30_003799 [Lodderomyces elongisporus]WLF80031.1 hypothetical protein PVL30_003799 [Lodderomyces elongisporus]
MASLLAHRVDERVVTELYQKLTQHKQSQVRIQPRIEYTALFAKSLDKSVDFRIADSLVSSGKRYSQAHLTTLLESSVFHIVCVIECLRQGKDVSFIHKEFFYNVNNKCKEHEVDSDFTEDVKHLATTFNITPNDLLGKGIRSFYNISRGLGQNTNILTLENWIGIMSSESVSLAFSQMNSNVPAFIMFDTLNRTPRYREEYLMQYELWINNTLQIMQQKRQHTSSLKACIKNLARHAVMFESASLAPLLKHTINFSKSRNMGFKIELEDSFVCDLIWNLALISVKYQYVEWMHVADAQKILMNSIGKGPDGHRSLTYRAYLGIAIVMAQLSKTKGYQIFKAAQSKFPLDLTTSNKKDLTASFITEILLAESSEEALRFFAKGSLELELSSSIWLALLQRLKNDRVMTEAKALALFRKLLNSKTKITGDLLTEFLRPVQTIETFDEMYSSVGAVFNNKEHLFFAKYLRLLLDDSSILSSDKKIHYSWDPTEYEWNDNCINHRDTRFIEHYIERLRLKYSSTSIQFTSLCFRLIAKFQKQNVWDFYKEEIILKNHLPNAPCLEVLLDSAIEQVQTQMSGQEQKHKHKHKHTQLQQQLSKAEATQEFPAPHFAIREFQIHVKQSCNEFGIRANDTLWIKYIHLLDHVKSISELSKIIKWWVDVKFHPKKNTLLRLLAALPEDFAVRHIIHHEKVHSKEDWDWPTLREFKEYMIKFENDDLPKQE